MDITKEKFLYDLNKMAMTTITKSFVEAPRSYQYKIFSSVIKSYLSENWGQQNKKHRESSEKQVYYFSLEFLLGKMLSNNIINLGLEDICNEVMDDLGISLEALEEQDTEPGLGNAGIGRLAAGFLDSMAATDIIGHGCGIRYDYGLFEQKIINGEQIEGPDNWLKDGFVWENKKNHQCQTIKFGGEVSLVDIGGRLTPVHTGYEAVLAVPYDIPVLGYKNSVVNNLRLWQARLEGPDFDFKSFSSGTFSELDEKKRKVEAISKLLYPDNTTEAGQTLRLKQEYFFVSAGLQSIVQYNTKKGVNPRELDKMFSIQMNSSHSALCIPELMRILLDDKHLEWNESWEITKKIMGYTNHSVLNEAFQNWEVEKIKCLLPRIYMIIKEINRRFSDEVYRITNDWDKVEEVAIIKDGIVDFMNLAIIGSHSINGVSKLHTDILKNKVFSNFYKIYPERFNNKTNGITQRRWLIQSNKALTKLIDETIGCEWKKSPKLLNNIYEYSNDVEFGKKIEGVKRVNKERLAKLIYKETGIEVDINSIFDTHIKKMSGHKRHLLSILHIIYLYNDILESVGEGKEINIHSRTFIFSAKSAPGYYLGKRLIKLINSLGKLINNDDRVNRYIKVIFISNYNVSKAQVIIPGSDVGEQISIAGKEANGTTGLKFMMNGALTLGTLDGVTIEIRDKVGPENIFVFGSENAEIEKLRVERGYNPMKILAKNEKLDKVVEMLRNGIFGGDFSSAYSHLVDGDRYFVLKDFETYLNIQNRVEETYKNREKWNAVAVRNIAKSGDFSSDLSIKEYAEEIWGI